LQGGRTGGTVKPRPRKVERAGYNERESRPSNAFKLQTKAVEEHIQKKSETFSTKERRITRETRSAKKKAEKQAATHHYEPQAAKLYHEGNGIITVISR